MSEAVKEQPAAEPIVTMVPTPAEEPAVVLADPKRQAGEAILVGVCPKCTRNIALNGEGKIICECGAFLRFKAR